MGPTKNEKSRPFKRGKECPEHSDRHPKERNPRPATAGAGEASEELTDNLVFDSHATIEVLQQRYGNELFLQEDAHGGKIGQLKQAAKEQAVPVKWVSKARLDTMSNHGVYQDMVLAITTYQYLTLEELLEQTKEKTEAPSFLVLDSLEDPYNSSSVLRTTNTTDVDGIIAPKHHAVGATSAVTKASTGVVEHVPVVCITNLAQNTTTLKENRFWVFSTDMSGTDYRRWNTQGVIVLIIGNGGRDVSQGLHKGMDELLAIPMTGHVRNLDAGVVADLLVYKVYRGRNPLWEKAIV